MTHCDKLHILYTCVSAVICSLVKLGELVVGIQMQRVIPALAGSSNSQYFRDKVLCPVKIFPFNDVVLVVFSGPSAGNYSNFNSFMFSLEHDILYYSKASFCSSVLSATSSKIFPQPQRGGI